SDSFPVDTVNLSDQVDVQTLQSALKDLQLSHPPVFVFIHFSNPDYTGHHEGWSVDGNSSYMKAVFKLDDYLGHLMAAVEELNAAGQSTILIVTADHGGTGEDHGDNKDQRNFKIPFMVWGSEVARGKDLYRLNKQGRADPGNRQVSYENHRQPIR